MVSIQVEGLLFELETKDVIGSKTIENLLQYYNIDDSSQTRVDISLGVNLDVWYEYLDFLDYGQPTIGALKVIDYVDNTSQARTWCELYYRLLRRKHGLRNTDDTKDIKNILTQTINDNTQFVPQYILPFNLLDTFESILPRVKELSSTSKHLQYNIIQHIINTLFSSYVVNTYNNIVTLKSINNILDGYMTKINSKRFILQTDTGNPKAANDNIILYYDDVDYYSSGNPYYPLRLIGDNTEFISLRVAAYYGNIKVYDMGYKNLIYCTNDKPYIENWKVWEGFNQVIHATCSSVKQVSSLTAIDNIHYKPNIGYSPFEGFDTGMDITGTNTNYKLYCYNKPSTYGKNYYIYLPYEYDPIIKVVYAFCV